MIRIAICLFHGFCAIAFVMLTGPVLKNAYRLNVDDVGTPVLGLADFSEFNFRFGFIGIFFVMVFDFVAWLVIRRMCRPPHHWKWLLVCTVAIPVIMVVTWLAIGPAVRGYYRIT